MIQTIHEFEDSSAFERTALATVFPLLHHRKGSGGLDLRSTPNNMLIGVAVTIGQDTRSELVRDLRPLLFGAAWKVLDLLVELALWNGPSPATKPAKIQISEKQTHARTGVLLPLSSDLNIWLRLAALYSNTVEARHCLVHRRFVFDSASNITQLRSGQGIAIRDVTVPEQEAFCRLVQCVSACAIQARLTARDKQVAADALDTLSAHHSLGVLGGGARTRVPETVYVNANLIDGKWSINTRMASERANESMPGRSYFDLEVHFPDSGIPPIRGRLEEAPLDDALTIDPGNPPSWVEP